MSRSRSRLAADWFAKLRLNDETNKVEHTDVKEDITNSSMAASDILTEIKTVNGSGSGLDADLLDGQQGSYYYPASNPNGYTNDQTASEILTAIKTVDGSGSGLDADLLDGLHSSSFLLSTAKAADSNLLDGNDSTVFAKKTDYATSTTGGTVKLRVNGSALYITTNGSNA